MQKIIRQGDSLSPLLFIVIIDKIIKGILSNLRGYKIGYQELKVVCNADDVTLIAENKYEFQRLFFFSTQHNV